MKNESKLNFGRVISALLTTLALAGSGTASAFSVNQWDYILDSGFSAFAPAGGAAVTGQLNNVLLGLPTKLVWPTNDATQSSLSVGSATLGHLAGTLTTDAAAIPTVILTHSNNVINGTSLLTATLKDQLQLRQSGVGSFFTLANLSFNINFLETDNDGSCEVAGGPACRDIFVINAVGAGFNPGDLSFNQNFLFAPTNEVYNAKIFLAGLGVLTDAACDAVFGNTTNRGCIGLVTDEGQNNNFQARLQISSVAFNVPEPGTVALLGVALLGFGTTRRKAG
jgi:hypothetical protein